MISHLAGGGGELGVEELAIQPLRSALPFQIWEIITSVSNIPPLEEPQLQSRDPDVELHPAWLCH